jgi:hypothetical protein
MLTLRGEQVESLWDEVLPIEARELPDDLARLDRVLLDAALLGPVGAAWEGSARGRGRPSIAVATFVRLWWSSSAPVGATRRWCGRFRTRCICGASV